MTQQTAQTAPSELINRTDIEAILNMDTSTLIDVYILPYGTKLLLALAIFFIGRIVVKSLVNINRRIMQASKVDKMLVNFISAIVNALLMLFVLVAALDQLGFNTTSLVALLGAAGLAIGLSLQDSLKNFAAGVMLIVFRPFKVGNYIEAAGISGTVVEVGIFSTTMKTPDNKRIIVPNGKIYGDNIINFSAMPTRRVDMVFGISYDDDIRKAKAVLQELLMHDDRILAEPEPVLALSELADSSVNFVVRPWVKSADYWALRWDFTEQVKLRFDEEGINFPYPQMDVHVRKITD